MSDLRDRHDQTNTQAEVALPTKEEDVEALWQQARQELRVPVEEKKEKRSAETKRSDEDKVFR